MDIKVMYDEIIEVNYDHWIVENDISGTSFEQFRMEVDITYREQFDNFPLWDLQMESRLDQIADIVGENHLTNSTSEEDEEIEEAAKQDLKEILLSHIELFLRYKAKLFQQEYPQSRMLKRKDVWKIQEVDFNAGDIPEKDSYLEVFEELVSEGYYKLVESGGDSKHDIFHVLQV